MNQMEHFEDLVQRFLKEENFSLLNSLSYAGLGLSKTTGQANDIIAGIGFADNQYSPQLQIRMSEILGEMLFYWHVLALTTSLHFHEIIEEYMHSYEAIREKLVKQKVTIQDMMDMKKHVKPEALASVNQDIVREKLEEQRIIRKKKLEQMLTR